MGFPTGRDKLLALTISIKTKDDIHFWTPSFFGGP
jgi:hypothetical protein